MTDRLSQSSCGSHYPAGDGTRLARLTSPVVYDPKAQMKRRIRCRLPYLSPACCAQAGTCQLCYQYWGVANASFITDTHLEGCDIGPGNALIDDLPDFYQRPFDEGGRCRLWPNLSALY